MKKRTSIGMLVPAVAVSLALTALLQGCGGERTHLSVVSGTIADINRNPIVGAKVWVDDYHQTQSLSTGTYRLEGVESGWRTVWASADISGQTWIGSAAAEILRDQPTMNIHITLAPVSETTEIRGYVEDDTGHPVEGARVLLTTRLLSPPEDTDAYDGPYGSMVAVTNGSGEYRLENVPVGLKATIAASKVGFYNQEKAITTASPSQLVDFTLQESHVAYRLEPPDLDAVESYTMPDTMTRSDADAFKAIRAITSPRYFQAIAKQKQVMTRATPPGSLIEIDLYWNALNANDSQEIAGYGIYRGTAPRTGAKAIDFVRDPYANFYSDTDIAITPYVDYYYAVTAVDVEFLDQFNNPDPGAESEKSNWLAIRPLGQLKADSPEQGAVVSENPLFNWSALVGAAFYKVFVYDEFPTLAADPSRTYTSPQPPPGVVTLPIWPRTLDSNESRVEAGTTSIHYTGPALTPGKTYYWLVMAKDEEEWAVSYSQLRYFTVAR
ncbi:MAG TPA: carboxypeptidase-like regulatory domain-containing protein [Armatimonadota bacterium]|nr:carboxypeptidase-like regulatory domain-containing protein [Armatimonadota bacterium]